MAEKHEPEYPILEFIHHSHHTAEKLERRYGQVDLGRIGLTAVAGGRAFRTYGALSNKIGLNKAGNLRGMVINAKWRVIFGHLSEVGEYMENLGYLAAIVAGVAEAAPRFSNLMESGADKGQKGLELLAMSGTIAQRALLGVIPTGTHLIYRSLQGWCMMAGLAGGSFQAAGNQCVQTLNSADTLVQTTFKTITDTGNQSKAVWYVIEFATSRFGGK